MTYAAGDVIGDEFEVLGRLGAGAYSDVFRVRRLLDEREYALKLFHSGRSRDVVRRELRALQGLNHPNIVKVIWGGETRDGDWYLLTEVVEGQSLRNFMEIRDSIDVKHSLTIVVQLLSALASFHPDEERIREIQALDEISYEQLEEIEAARGMVHRDIKPENLMVTDAGNVMLIDFNISSRVGSPVATTSFTPGYSPPDANLGGWTVDWDLFATGVVLFELLCGDHPYAERNPNDPGGLRDPSVLNPELIDEVTGFLRRSCSQDADSRFSTASEMLVALRACMPVAELPIIVETRCAQPELFPRPRRFYTEPLDLFADEQLPFDKSGSQPASTNTLKRIPAASADQPEVIDAIVELVRERGPIRCNHLYRLYAQGSGAENERSVRSALNRATYAAVTSGRLAQVESLGGGQLDKTVYLPDTPETLLRSIGDRKVTELPPSELMAALGQIESGGEYHGRDEAMRELARRYSVEEDTLDFWLLNQQVEGSERDPNG